jgi:hypothetical protein
MKTILYSFILLISTHISCFAETDKKMNDSFVAGAGAIICYDFIHPKKENDYVGRDNVFLTWAQGYMSAYNQLGDKNEESVNLGIISLEEQIVILKIYCEDHKRNSFWGAAINLYSELYKKGKR